MTQHGGRPEQITEIAMDMCPACIAGAMAYFSAARVLFDAFHIMKKAGQTLDKVRKDLTRQGQICAVASGPCEAMRGRAAVSSRTPIPTHGHLPGLGTRGGFA